MNVLLPKYLLLSHITAIQAVWDQKGGFVLSSRPPHSVHTTTQGIKKINKSVTEEDGLTDDTFETWLSGWMAVYPPGCVARRVNMAANTFKGGSGTLNLLTAILWFLLTLMINQNSTVKSGTGSPQWKKNLILLRNWLGQHRENVVIAFIHPYKHI